MSLMATGEVDARTRAALDLAGSYVFGTEPGRIPAVLFEAYDASTADVDRALLGAALARCWAYAGERSRAAPFAVAAVKHAEATGDPAVVADSLDAALATHWGPDELEVRVDLAGRLADVSAHLSDVDARTTAHLWLFTVAAETLDVSELNRQMRALERLGEESRRSLFFAASRRLMLDLMRGRTDSIGRLVALAEETADELPDGRLVLAAMIGYSGVQSGDRSDAVIARASWGEALAEREGIREVYAEIAWIYLGLGLADDARRLASTFDERVLAHLRHDHNYLLVLQLLLDVALATGLDELVGTITPLLLPYAGRAVINSGGVMFHGVTDDTLARACQRLGDAERADALREKALATYRRIGASWWRERLEAVAPPASPRERTTSMTLRPGPAGVWLVGGSGVETVIPARRGLEHLHTLLAHPGVEVAALHLAGGAQTVDQAGLGEVIDAQALAAYRRRLAEIDAALDRADASGDAGLGTELTSEREALLAQVAAATGLGGRTRTTGSSAERARVTVRKAIAAALDAIHGADPVVARHLTTHVRTGVRCCYEPDPDASIDWRL
jgi:tetratricopeptide (TPR) repeat protein